MLVERKTDTEVEAEDVTRCDLANRFLLTIEHGAAEVVAREVVQVAEGSEEHRRIAWEQPGDTGLNRVEAGAGRQTQWQAGAGRVASAALHTIGDHVEGTLAGVGLVAQPA